MATNKHALIRYLTIDKVLKNGSRKISLDTLIEACELAVGVSVSKRTIQLDIENMRYSEALGFNAPIEYYQYLTDTFHPRFYYRYSEKKYSIISKLFKIQSGIVLPPIKTTSVRLEPVNIRELRIKIRRVDDMLKENETDRLLKYKKHLEVELKKLL